MHANKKNTTPEVKKETNFDNFGLNENLLTSIKEIGFQIPSPIQEKAIPVVLQGSDVIAQAQTGTGKTAAFGLPCLNQLKRNQGVELLIITPTRELASQVSDEIYRFGKYDKINTVTVYGGQSYGQQIERIHRGAEVVVATPGRLLDLLQSKRLRDFNPSMVVLDEADEMLDMGFLDDIKKIFSFIKCKKQTLLFSATMPAPIKKLANTILNEPVLISVIDEKERLNKDTKEVYCIVEEHERDEAAMRIIDTEEPKKTIIFCRTKREVDRLSENLLARGYLAHGLHGDMDQKKRQRVIQDFHQGVIHILIATDVAARGLDVEGVTHVFNFHLPFGPENYLHRIGRTGRAGQKGIAITFVSQREIRGLKRIKDVLGSKIENQMVPTLEDIKKINESKLLTELKEQSISKGTKAILKKFTKEIKKDELIEKMLTYLLQKKDISGPEKIGTSGDDAKRFLLNMDRADDGRSFRSNRGRRGRSSRGGWGGRSSGGYRSEDQGNRGFQGSDRKQESGFSKSSSRSFRKDVRKSSRRG